jgi:Holliday junction resolvase RusA-like endonuclease
MSQSIFFPDQFTSLNDYISAERGNKYQAAVIKRSETQRVQICAMQAGLRPVQHYPVALTFTWIRKNRRSDPDNIVAAKKYILDGLVRAGVLRDDGWDEIVRFTDIWEIDRDHPGVKVSIEEVI